jgi:hypothetical protein
LAEGGEAEDGDAAPMPSWSPADPQTPEKAGTPSGTLSAAAIERARRLLEQLLGSQRDHQPPPPRQ